ncbi:MAG: hypothetical protein CM1200mP12_00450 [Gammaproteobacteria bacterium]|nr:MAG: hypothetical protein CM1200mP12_00450 [Gammaproteobacteria bacterium]
MILRGGVDDVWIDKKTNQLIVVDYKATSKKGKLLWVQIGKLGTKNKWSFTQRLFRGNSFDVSDTAYFVYCNGIKDKNEFNNQIEFKIKLIPYMEMISGLSLLERS